MLKKPTLAIVLVLAMLMSACASTIPEAEYAAVVEARDAFAADKEGLQKQLSTLQTERDKVSAEYLALQAEYAALLEDRESIQESNKELEEKLDAANTGRYKLQQEYDAYKEETADFVKMGKDERAAAAARAEADRIKAEEEREKAEAAARAAKEAEEKKAAEEARKAEEKRLAEEAKGYETGIKYKDLARNPDDYEGEKVKFTGYVLQVQEGDTINAVRMSTSGKYNDVIYVAYDPGLLDSRILEDDKVTIYGISYGLHTYTTVMGASVTIPLVLADRIEVK